VCQDERQPSPCTAGLFPPLREEERALPASSPRPQTSFRSSLPSAPEKETSERGNLPGVCSGRAQRPRRSALRRAGTRGEGKDRHQPPAPGQRYLESTWKKGQRFLVQTQSLPRLPGWALERSARALFSRRKPGAHSASCKTLPSLRSARALRFPSPARARGTQRQQTYKDRGLPGKDPLFPLPWQAI